MNGLSVINVELTSRCNKSCWMCGRRRMERDYPELCDWGDMPTQNIFKISKQVEGITVQFHNNGEPLLYPHLGWVLGMFQKNIRCFNTNGNLLLEKADQIIGNLETLTISIIQDDPEGDEQYETVCKFIDIKGDEKPIMVYRLLGDVEKRDRWEKLPGIVANRILHAPGGSFNYEKKVTIPEIGICLDLLSHLAIDRYGNISTCVRFDPKGELIIGNVRETTIEEAWTSQKRKKYLEYHIAGRRKELPGCSTCEFWGVPTGQ